MNKQGKKLTLNKETLRDLTTQNVGEVKGGTAPSYRCTLTCKCHGKTYNNKCVSLNHYTCAYC